MHRPRVLFIALGIFAASFSLSTRSASAQTCPDWPTGGTKAQPALGHERPAAIGSTHRIDRPTVLVWRFRNAIPLWLARVTQRPARQTLSIPVAGRRLVK
jgi:hypothetical protein